MLTYKDSGVDTKEGERAVSLMKKHVTKTFTSGVLTGLGSFGAMFSLKEFKNMEEPVLVSGTDGVGTKLKIAFMMDKHDTVGQDLVAMCANDILCQGAKPLFFLDYIATGKLDALKTEKIVKGIADACFECDMSLVGGETAEMPGFYTEDEYDLAGFSVGIVDRKNIVDGSKDKKNCDIIAIASSGLHSNGYSLVRKVLFEKMAYKVDCKVDGLDKILGEELLTPTKLYVKPVLEVLKNIQVLGMVHMTGGGFFENIPRVLNSDENAHINLKNIKTPKIFDIIQKCGNISRDEMFKAFNMGVGFLIFVSKDDTKNTLKILEQMGENPYVIGEVLEGEKGVTLCE